MNLEILPNRDSFKNSFLPPISGSHNFLETPCIPKVILQILILLQLLIFITLLMLSVGEWSTKELWLRRGGGGAITGV